jgi:hypothetical protein
VAADVRAAVLTALDALAADGEVAVKRDVRDGCVSIDGAARDYGVVITSDPDEDPEGLALDLAATQRLRADRGAPPRSSRSDEVTL